MRLPRALSSCVRRVDRLDDAPLRQEGPADAVAQDDPPVGGSSQAASGSEEWARATTDAEDESNTGASDVEKPVEQPKVRKKGVRFKRKEQDEYCAGVDDEDMKMDTERQFLKVQIHMHRLAVRCAEKAAREKAVGGDFTCKAGEDAVREEMESLRAAAAKVNVEALKKQLAAAEQKAEDRKMPPGMQGDVLPDQDMSGPAVAHFGKHAQRQALIVPSATKPLSMFDAKTYSMVHPKCFPYGDGVFGIARDVSVAYGEYCEYLLMRDELEYDTTTNSYGGGEAVNQGPESSGHPVARGEDTKAAQPVQDLLTSENAIPRHTRGNCSLHRKRLFQKRRTRNLVGWKLKEDRCCESLRKKKIKR